MLSSNILTAFCQHLSLGLFRSDYMVHHDSEGLQIKQVEFNTIASSFGGLSSQTSSLHRYSSPTAALPPCISDQPPFRHLAATEYPLLQDSTAVSSLDLPANNSTTGLAAGLKAAYDAYGPSPHGHPTCVVFLVQDGERNIFAQRHLEYALQGSGAPVFRLPFSEILARTGIPSGDPQRPLLYHPPHNPPRTFEVAVAYLRAGYGPGDYPSSSAWEARYRIERSRAIACPSVLTQLAGMKKVQQVLATPGDATLDRFIPNGTDRAAVRRTFTNIFPLDATPAGLAARKLATDPEECQRYVMKPQREGGGNNFYRGAIPEQLQAIPEAHWGAHILMELITPPPLVNVILRNGKLEQGGVICELGVYGTCLWDQTGKGFLHSEESGYLLRTKGDQSEEGGVAAGYGCMDSCALV